MRRLCSLQDLVILFIISISTIGLSYFWINAHAENTTISLSQHGLTPEINGHNMSQMLQRGNIVMGFDQNKVVHKFSSTKDGGQIKITAIDGKDNRTSQGEKDSNYLPQ